MSEQTNGQRNSCRGRDLQTDIFQCTLANIFIEIWTKHCEGPEDDIMPPGECQESMVEEDIGELGLEG